MALSRGNILVLCATLAFVTSKAEAQTLPSGTGAGNDFEHFTNQAFDFHIAKPLTWSCKGCPDMNWTSGGREAAETWRLTSPNGGTWLEVEFISGFPATAAPELLAEITRKHPDTAWHAMDPNGPFIGFSSSDLGNGAPQALEYYLVDRNLAIRIMWLTDSSDAQAAADLMRIRASVNRASTPPFIKSIRTEKQSYRVGDVACYHVEVDDLRNGFDASTLSDFEIEGAPTHFSFKRISWNGEASRFEVCFRVTTAFGPNGLRIRMLGLSAGRALLSCSQSQEEPAELKCNSNIEGESGNPAPSKMLRPDVANVDNPDPDVTGPEIQGLKYSDEDLSLVLQVSDASGVAFAEIKQSADGHDDKMVTVFPDQLAAGAAIDLRPILRPGWNSVTRIVVFDNNGLPTMLRVKPTKTRANEDHLEMYELVPWAGSTSSSGIPVVRDLVHKGEL